MWLDVFYYSSVHVPMVHPCSQRQFWISYTPIAPFYTALEILKTLFFFYISYALYFIQVV